MRIGFLITPVALIGLAAGVGGCSTAPVQSRHPVAHARPATNVTCRKMEDVNFSDNGSASSSTQHNVCKSPKGQLHES